MKNLNTQFQKSKRFGSAVSSLGVRFLILAIRVYQRTLSPGRGPLFYFFGAGCCRFYPSCSDYSVLSLRQYGLFLGIVASLKRILRCNPWSRGGYDPVR